MHLRHLIALTLLALAGLPAHLAAADPEPLAIAAQPLPAFVPPEREMTLLPTPIPLAKLVIPLGGSETLVPAQVSPVIDLDGAWRCSGLTTSTKPFPDDAQLAHGWQSADFDDQAWDRIAVPLDWYRAYPKARSQAAPYVIGWYRRTIELGHEADGRRTIMHLGVAGYEADLWVNGHAVGSHHGDFTPWDVDISTAITAGRNVLALRVRSDFGPKFGAANAARHTYGSQWSIGNIKGGLWQSCRLSLESPVRVAELLVSPQWEQRALRVDWKIDNQTGAAQRISLRAIVQNARDHTDEQPTDRMCGDVDLVPGENSGSILIPVPDIHPWSPERPELYWLSVLAVHDGRIVGARSERFGFRSFVTRGGTFLLNGTRTYLFGENLKSLDYGGIGESPEAFALRIERDLTGLKKNGYTMFRTAHMPVEPLLLQRADELGLMVYDEWSWTFTDHLDPVEFPRRNDQELSEWVRRDYNHPAVVMWSCGNEVHYDDDAVRTQLDRQVTAVRALDHSGRPVSSFSGAAYGYGSKPLATDVLDRHSYFGLGSGAWTGWERNSAEARTFLDRTYGDGWATRMPFIIWESVGFSWGQLSDPVFRPGNPDDYLTYANRTATWSNPAGIGFAGTVGLAAFFDPQRGLAAARRTYGRRIAEAIRRDASVSGFAPWFTEPQMAEARQWTQPVFVTLAGENHLPLRHPFGGRSYAQKLLVINDGAADLVQAHVQFSLADGHGDEHDLSALALPQIPAGQRLELPVTITMPVPAAAGWCQLRLRIIADGHELSRLGYDLFIAPAAIAHAPITPTRSTVILTGGNDVPLRRWLADLGISARQVVDLHDLRPDEALVIPPGRSLNQDEAIALRTWIRTGGTALILEQPAGAVTALNQNAVPAGNTFIDLVKPTHPLFAGLSPEAFDTCDHPKGGWWVSAALKPLTVNVIAARGAMLGLNDGTSGVISEGTLGSGRLLASQLLALDQWDVDSVATVYLTNLARYALTVGAKPAPETRAWQDAGKGLAVDHSRCRSLDLRPLANRSFTDDADNDGKGGWTDQGGNDFRDMPLGEQTLHGIPFTIIDPATNDGRSCVVLGGGGRPNFPREAHGVAVDGLVSRLFFLHTAAWIGSQPTTAMIYRITYADASVIEIPIRSGSEIADWWNPCELTGALLGLSQTNGQLHDIALFLMPWDNPRPDLKIATIDIISTGKNVPIVVAITAESGNASPAHFGAANDPLAWKSLIDWPGRAPEKSGPGLPVISAATDLPPGIAAATRIAFPESPSPTDAKIVHWGAPTAFIALPATELIKLATGKFHSLTFWISADVAGTIDVVLPFAGWKDNLHAAVSLTPATGWKKIRLDLTTDLQQSRGKSWKATDLMGELFLFHGRRTAIDAPRPRALTISVADPRLE